jgi:aerobic C4-dicarboxylate transport protein
MPTEDPIHVDDVADLDEDLAEYGHHAPKHAVTAGPARPAPAAVEPSTPTDRRPAYSESV